jgi:hypothetical protein
VLRLQGASRSKIPLEEGGWCARAARPGVEEEVVEDSELRGGDVVRGSEALCDV